MAARIFISYRTADGADKATALARDLGRVFGDDAVFLDKDDLHGGALWAQAVADALGAKPVLLLLVTPQLFDATDADGRRRIDDPDDPVRREIATALAAGAALIPVLCDGVPALPPDDALPPPLAGLADRTWRRLRAYDWAADVARLVADLHAHGIAPAARARRRGLRWGAAGVALLALGGAAAWWAQRAPDRADASRGSAGASRSGLGGTWAGLLGPDPVRVRTARGRRAADAGQRADRHPLARRLGRLPALLAASAPGSRARRRLRLRGDGTLRTGPGTPPVIDMALTVLTLPDETVVDGGNLTATLGPDGRLRGTRWLNSTQRSLPAELVRLR